MADWAGKTLGKVHIEDLIARGGMAEVYTGTHESFGRVAVKVMRGLLEKDSDQLARFQREAEVIEDLRHQNIVRMLEYDVVDESPYLIMEYIPGPSLAAYLKKLHDKKQRLPIALVAHILKSIASALDYAHLKGIVHRDIKPANVLLRSQSEIVELGKPLPADVEPILTDFGLVRLLDSTMHTTAGSVSGTPAYMSPEQARGEKVDKRTDIYALGIMLYEMLAGVVPFQADTTFGMLMKHINDPPPPIEGISPELQMVIDRALAKDPALRYASAGELANEFMAIFNGQTVSPGTLHIAQLARQAAQGGQAARPQPAERPRSRWIRMGIEFAVVIALGFVVFQFIPRNPITATASPPPLDPNIPVGTMRFSEFDSPMDTVSFSLTKATAPENGTHYEAWLINDDGWTHKDIGTITFDAGGTGQLPFTDQDGLNLLQDYDQIQITKEQDGIPISAPTGEVVYSSIFPPQSLVEVRNVLVSFDGVPDSLALMQGLYYYSGTYIDYSMHGDEVNDPEYTPLLEAYEKGDEDTVRKRTEEIINLIVGDQSDLYLDYDKDGVRDNSESDGYGSLPAGDRLGYLGETTLHLKSASEAPDSTPNIREQSDNIQICIQNMDDWTKQILRLALQLADTPFGSEMRPIIDEMSTLTTTLVDGVDVDEDGLVEPIAGECGVGKAYIYGQLLADFPIFTGPDRNQPAGK